MSERAILSAIHAVMFLGGVSLVSVGAWFIYRPAGIIVLGASMATTAAIGALRAQGGEK